MMRCTACVLLLTLLALAGCSTCSSPHDRAYAAYGGLWERTDECEGRVGSAFTPAGIRISDGELSADAMPFEDTEETEGTETW